MILKLQKKTNLSEEKRWDDLVNAIFAGQVIPVIGPEFLIENPDEESDETPNLHELLIDALAGLFGDENSPKTFSQLIHGDAFKKEAGSDKDVIYRHIFDAITQIEQQEILHPKKLLVKLLETKLFPFVITTSFTPVVENVMRGIWGDDVRVLQFRNDSNRDQKVGHGDIQNESELNVPTVYYMFGKCSIEPHRYVVSDIDMMEFCKSWLTGGAKVPRVFYEALKKRYLLILGNNYSDWLFRFIWYAIRTNTSMRSSLILNDKIDNSLANFLEQLETFITSNPGNVIDKIIEKVNIRKEKERLENEGAGAQNGDMHDVFVSYSRSDSEITRRLVKALQDEGLDVWFDSDKIEHAEDWKRAITRGIRNSRLFIPVLSHNIEREYMKEHEYREEWSIAASRAAKMGGRKFIWPLSERGFNFYNDETKLPKEFTDMNTTTYDIADDFKEFARKIKNAVEDLKLKEQQMTGYGK